MLSIMIEKVMTIFNFITKNVMKMVKAQTKHPVHAAADTVFQRKYYTLDLIYTCRTISTTSHLEYSIIPTSTKKANVY